MSILSISYYWDCCFSHVLFFQQRQYGLWSCELHAWPASKSIYRTIVIVTAIVSITDSSYSFIPHAMSYYSLTNNPFLYITGTKHVRKIKVCKALDGARRAVKRQTLVCLGQLSSHYEHLIIVGTYRELAWSLLI